MKKVKVKEEVKDLSFAKHAALLSKAAGKYLASKISKSANKTFIEKVLKFSSEMLSLSDNQGDDLLKSTSKKVKTKKQIVNKGKKAPKEIKNILLKRNSKGMVTSVGTGSGPCLQINRNKKSQQINLGASKKPGQKNKTSAKSSLKEKVYVKAPKNKTGIAPAFVVGTRKGSKTSNKEAMIQAKAFKEKGAK